MKLKIGLKLQSLLLLTVLLCGALQCSTPQKWTRSGLVLVPRVELTEELTQVTRVGQNHSPQFSPDGSKIVFISQERPQHSYGQVYEIHLNSQNEQRLTFQGAENADPQYIRDGKWLIYSSATDETKERAEQDSDSKASNFVGPSKYNQPMELYLHNLEQFEVLRLTSLPGYDGEAFWNPSHESVVFTRRKGDELFLYRLSSKKPKIVRPFSSESGNSQWSSSKDGQSQVWIQWKKDFKSSDLKVRWPSGYVTLLPDFDRIKKDPNFNEDLNVIFFSMNHPNRDKFNVFSIHLDGTCLTQWTNENGDNVEPTLSPDKSHLAFSSNRSGSYQIYLRDWPRTLPCATFKKDLK